MLIKFDFVHPNFILSNQVTSPRQGIIYFISHLFHSCQIKFVCIYVAIFGQVHDVETVFHK